MISRGLKDALQPYESNTPSLRNMFHGDDPDNMPFMPFADDPSFDGGEHQRHYKTLSWQNVLFDPDLHIVVLETARRLLHEHAVSAEAVDATNILPMPLLSVPGKRGALEQSLLRDYPSWSGSFPGQPISHLSVPDFADLHARISSSVRHFCPNINCVDPYCPTHIEICTVPTLQIARLLNDEMRTQVMGSCGKDCFLHEHEASPIPSAWSQNVLNDFASIIQLMPDTSPCDLAIICRKPCWEGSSNFDSGIKKSNRPVSDIVNKWFIFNHIVTCRCGPCRHVGSCTEYIKSRDGSVRQHCVCALNKTYCERNCGCSAECREVRWSGCTCSRRAGVCISSHCPCVREGRECDPELCLKCEARYARNICQNAQIQQGRRKRLSVKTSRSNYGLGAFLDESARHGDLIGEYVGEIIYEPTVQSREDVAQHRRRNYVFELNETFSLDSSNVGNETRFINHSSTNANCKALVILVNGEHRIGVYATKSLGSGVELRLNYGSQFFVNTSRETTPPLLRSNSPSV
ncbi:SET domain-containing protein [Neolentinus lepideus HHB14362 ss-1]|uniref:SET domain-containing protein n=1 Tax=Neolentinus lepideus HHB14362 ss-1 TaxID=1314782 RepID=A0A165MY96_9AGAM|nr:SET domain-containing protein [Neolentinus lepideus HHB14362 ss-1]